MLGVDLSGDLVAGCSSDKTSRIWNIRSGRLIHQLVGHAHKVNCLRFCPDGRSVVTASADRSIKLWDIARNTYRQTTTMRHGSSSNTVDVSADISTVVSGHMDGGLRFFDLRTGDRTADVPSLHTEGITSVGFDPMDSRKILTNGKDSALKIVDVRMCRAVQEFTHEGFRTTLSWSGACFSPDGNFVAAGCNQSGTLFIWKVDNGQLEKQLMAHDTGCVGVTWGRGGSSTQQVSSIDRTGRLVLWA